jgi:hypothetical protein
MSDWKTLVYDEAGNVVGEEAGYTPIAKPRVECYYGMTAAKKPRKGRRPRFTEAPMWSALPQGWHRNDEQVNTKET